MFLGPTWTPVFLKGVILERECGIYSCVQYCKCPWCEIWGTELHIWGVR